MARCGCFVVLHFYRLGYDAISIAFLFLFYEFFGIVTNLFGGWIAARSGVKVTLFGGLALQIGALLMLLLLNEHWSRLVSVAYVMCAQALSGIAKDLTKMSSKSAIKVIVPEGGGESVLFKWVARLLAPLLIGQAKPPGYPPRGFLLLSHQGGDAPSSRPWAYNAKIAAGVPYCLPSPRLPSSKPQLP